jgi:hypothetical protein
MSVENKIREFLGKTTVAEAYPGFGKSKEEESPMQGSSEKATTQTLDKGAGADAAVKAGQATSLAAGSGPMDKTNPTQGSSNASPEKEDLGTDEPGKVVAKKAKKMPGLPGHGAGNATNFTTMTDPASVVNQATSKGNVYKEDTDLEVEENDFITEEEYEALSDEEKAQYEVISEEEIEEAMKMEKEDDMEDEMEDEKEMKSKKKMKMKMKEDMNLDIQHLFASDENLSEEFKTKAVTGAFSSAAISTGCLGLLAVLSPTKRPYQATPTLTSGIVADNHVIRPPQQNPVTATFLRSPPFFPAQVIAAFRSPNTWVSGVLATILL